MEDTGGHRAIRHKAERGSFEMILPPELLRFLGTEKAIDRSGHSPAKVFETGKGYFVKCDEPGELAREFQMTQLFYEMGFGPEAVLYTTLDRDYLVTRKVPGEDLTKDLHDPLHTCRLLAEALRMLHAQPAGRQRDGALPVSSRYERYMASADGPSGGGYYDPSVYTDRYRLSSKEEAWEIMQSGRKLLRCDTLIHGDACLPNVMAEGGAFRSFIDVAMGGIGDRHIDLYWAVWSLEYNLKTDAYTDVFLDLYGRGDFSEDMFRVIAAFEAFG